MIETPRLVLRRPEPGDAAAIERQLADPEVMRYIGRGETGTYTDAVEQVAKMLRAWEQDGFGRFVVVRRETGAVIGRVGLLVWHPLTWRNGTRAEFGEDCEIELGWTLERAAWGRGFATEAATAARDWSFAELRLRRLISLIHAENTRSVRIAQRLDGRYERDVVTARGVAAQLWTLASPS